MTTRNKFIPNKLSIEPHNGKPCTFKDIVPQTNLADNIKTEKPFYKKIKQEDNQYFDYISFGAPSPEKILTKKRQRKNSEDSAPQINIIFNEGKKSNRRFEHMKSQRVNELCLNSNRRQFGCVSVCKNVESIFLKPIRNRVNCERVQIRTNFTSEDFLSQGRWSIPVTPEEDKIIDKSLHKATYDKRDTKPNYIISTQENPSEKKKRGRPKKQDAGMIQIHNKEDKERGKYNFKESIKTTISPLKHYEKKKENIFLITKDFSKVRSRSPLPDVRKEEQLSQKRKPEDNQKSNKKNNYSMRSSEVVLNTKNPNQSDSSKDKQVFKNFTEIFPSDCITTPSNNKVIKKSYFSPERTGNLRIPSKNGAYKKVNTIIIEKIESPKQGKSKIRETVPYYPNVLSCDFATKRNQSSSRKKY